MDIIDIAIAKKLAGGSSDPSGEITNRPLKVFDTESLEIEERDPEWDGKNVVFAMNKLRDSEYYHKTGTLNFAVTPSTVPPNTVFEMSFVCRFDEYDAVFNYYFPNMDFDPDYIYWEDGHEFPSYDINTDSLYRIDLTMFNNSMDGTFDAFTDLVVLGRCSEYKRNLPAQ